MPPRAASASRPTRSRSRTSGERAGGRVARPTRRQRASASALSYLRRHARPPCRASTPFSARPSAFGEIRAAPARPGRYFLKAKRPCPLIPVDDLASFRNFPCVCGCVRSEESPADWLRPAKRALAEKTSLILLNKLALIGDVPGLDGLGRMCHIPL